MAASYKDVRWILKAAALSLSPLPTLLRAGDLSIALIVKLLNSKSSNCVVAGTTKVGASRATAQSGKRKGGVWVGGRGEGAKKLRKLTKMYVYGGGGVRKIRVN